VRLARPASATYVAGVGKYLVLLFVVVPLVETFLLAKIGAAMGWTNTILLVLATGLIGGWLAKLEGARAWRKWREALNRGQMPEDGVLSGLLLLVGGALLITPGVLTDAVGFLLLLPPSRRAIASFIRPRLEKRFVGGASAQNGGFHYQAGQQAGHNVRVIRFGAVPDFGGPDAEPRREPIRRPPRQIIDAEFELNDPDET
jgi:UPF0716 protein FxsA